MRKVLANPPRPNTSALRQEYSWQGQEYHLVAVYDELFSVLRVPDSPMTPSDLSLTWSRV
jgi:hypothetical protein